MRISQIIRELGGRRVAFGASNFIAVAIIVITIAVAGQLRAQIPNRTLSQSSLISGERSASARVNDSIVYHGKLVNPSGQAVTGTLEVTIKIFSPEPSLCLLWSEKQTITARSGGFSMELGYGDNRLSGTGGGAATDFRSVFINNTGLTHSSASCVVGSSYTPSANDDRLMSAEFIDVGVSVAVEKIPIKSVPFAKQASEVGGFGIGNLFKISGAGSAEQFSPEEVTRLKAASAGGSANQILGISGTGGVVEYKSITAGTGIAVTHTSNGIQISATGGGGGGGITGAMVTAALGYTPISGASSAEVISALGYTPQSALTFTPQAQLGYTPVSKAGDYMTGALSLPPNGLSVGINQLTVSGGNIGVGTASPTHNITVARDAIGPVTSNAPLILVRNSTTDSSSYPYAGITIDHSNFNTNTRGGSYLSFSNSGTGGSAEITFDFFDDGISGNGENFKFINQTTTGNILFKTQSTNERLRITSAGNIGIGTATPGDKLHVEGKIRAQEICDTSGSNCKVISSGWTAGSVTSVGVGGAPLSVVNGTSTPTISIAQANGSQAGFLSAADWTSFNNKQPAGAYLTGITGAQVSSALGYTPVSNALPTNQTFFGNGSGIATAGFFGVGQLRNASGTAQIPASCAASQTLTWSAVTDVFNCTNIGSLPASAITSGTIDSARLPFGASLWQDAGSGKIHYSGGNVGVGTSSPQNTLQVSGAMVSTGALTTVVASSGTFDFSSGTTRIYSIGANSSTNGAFQIQSMRSDSSNVKTLIYGDASGNIGIGTTSPSAKLEVAGEVKFGNTSSTCNSANEGLQRYNSTSKQMEFCNGTSWASPGSASLPNCAIGEQIFKYYGGWTCSSLISKSCSEILSSGYSSGSGVYLINIGSSKKVELIDAYCDMTTDGGGWTLVLNYLHKAGTSPATVVMTDKLPIQTSTSLGTDGSLDSSSWGHAANSLMAKIPYSSVRISGSQSNHTRIVDFKTSDTGCVSYLKTGTGSCSGAESNYTALSDHSSTTPVVSQVALGAYWPSNLGDSAMLNIYHNSVGNTGHARTWYVGVTGLWRMDFDNGSNTAYDNRFQVWIK